MKPNLISQVLGAVRSKLGSDTYKESINGCRRPVATRGTIHLITSNQQKDWWRIITQKILSASGIASILAEAISPGSYPKSSEFA
jgi:hypothetical protein